MRAWLELRATIASDETKRGPLRCILSLKEPQIDPECCARLGLAQLDLGRPYARRCEPDDAIGPAAIGDGVSDQHVPQFASPQETSLSASVRFGPASTRRRYGSAFALSATSQ